MKNTTIILAALLSFVAALAQDIKPQIAVYVTGSIKENEKKVLNTEILDALVKSGRYTAIEQSKEFLATLDKEQKKQKGGAVDERQIKKIGYSVGIKFICIAEITKFSDEFQISTRIVSTDTAAAAAAPVIIGKAYSKLKSFGDFEEASDKIMESMFGGRAETNDKIKPAEITSPQAYNDRGIEFANNGELDKAIDDFTEAIRLNPSEAGYYINRGIAYSNKNEYYNAIDDFNKAIELGLSASNLFVAYNSRGTAYYVLEDYRRALEDYTKGIEISPSDADAYYRRGNTYRKLKNYDEAIDDYENALYLNPNHARAKENLQAVEQEKLAAQPPPPTMSEFWGPIYNPIGNDDLNAPRIQQNYGQLKDYGKLTPSASVTPPASPAAKAEEDSEEKNTRFGIKAAWYPGSSETGMHVKGGIFLDIPFSNIISFNPEVGYYFGGEKTLSYTYKNALYNFEREQEFTFSDVQVINIPLMLKLSPVSFLYLTAGFNTDIIIGSGTYDCYNYNSYGTTFCPAEDQERSSPDFGFIFGGGLLLGNHFVVDFRYIAGLTDICDECGTSSYYELGLGWMF